MMSKIRSVLQWSLAIFFMLIGLIYISTPIAGLAAFAIGFLKLPPVISHIQEKFQWKYGRLPRFGISVLLFIIFIIAAPSNPETTQTNIENSKNTPVIESNQKVDPQNEILEEVPITPINFPNEQGDNANTTTPVEKPKNTEPVTKQDPKPEKSTTSKCDPNYSGCVPIASDVDCAGGSGNGPAYTGRVEVIGSDIYDLDRDNDGIACE